MSLLPSCVETGQRKHLCPDLRALVYKYYSSGIDPHGCFHGLFLGNPGNGCTLMNIQRLYRMFNDPLREDQVEMYLLNANKKGPKFVDEFWYDNLVLKCHCQNPTASSYAVMLEVQSLLGDNIQAPSESTIRKCLLRNKMQMNRASYVSFL